jgi:hypothetical protein
MSDIIIETKWITVLQTVPATIIKTSAGYMVDLDGDTYLEDSQGDNTWDTLVEAQTVLKLCANEYKDQ